MSTGDCPHDVSERDMCEGTVGRTRGAPPLNTADAARTRHVPGTVPGACLNRRRGQTRTCLGGHVCEMALGSAPDGLNGQSSQTRLRGLRRRSSDVSGRDTSARISRQRVKRIWCVSSIEVQRRVAADGARRSRAIDGGQTCRARPTRASPARARRRARSPTAARGTPARARATARRRGTTRPGRARTPRRVAGSPVGGGGCLPHRSSPRAATPRRDARDAHRRGARSAGSSPTPSGGGIDADERDPRHPLRRDRGDRERVRPARPTSRSRRTARRRARATRPLRPRAQRARTHAPGRTGRRPAGGRRASAAIAVVGMPREPRVAAAVQVDDRRAARIADVVDAQRETTSVARIPSAR